jgi:glycosyltransferase involved in cell wall biosynthesis
MKITYIVSGTGGAFYCENCIRDCALISGLRAIGHEVIAVPMYLPAMHEENVDFGDAPVFFGAVRIYFKHLFPVLKWVPHAFLKSLDSPAMLSFAASKAGSTRAAGHEAMTLSMLKGSQGPLADEFERMVRWVLENIRPDAVFLSNGLLLGVAQAFKALSNVIVACLLQDEHTWIESSAPNARSVIWNAIRRQTAYTDRLFSLSAWYAMHIKNLMKSPDTPITVIPFGVDPARYQLTSGDKPRLGFLSRLCRDTGLNLLTQAYSTVCSRHTGPGLELSLCGGFTKDNQADVDECLRRAKACGSIGISSSYGLDGRREFLSTLSALSVPTPEPIALGAFIIEAFAAQVPVVLPDQGGFAEIVNETGGGILYSPNTPEALADAIERMFTDNNARKKFAQRGRKAVVEKFNHLAMAKAVMKALQ